MRDRLRALLASVLEVDPEQVPENASSITVEGWDSMAHIQIMLALEAELGVEIPGDTMLELTSLDEIERFVASGHSR